MQKNTGRIEKARRKTKNYSALFAITFLHEKERFINPVRRFPFCFSVSGFLSVEGEKMNKVVPIKEKPKSEAETLVNKCCDTYGLKADEREKVTNEVNQYMSEIYPDGTYMYFDRDVNMLMGKNNTFGESIKKTYSIILKLCLERMVSQR